MDVKYILKIFIIAFLIFSFILFIKMVLQVNITNKKYKKKLLSVDTVEGLTNKSIIIDKNNAFCESHIGQSGTLEKSCNKLTNKNCNSTSCCVWTSDSKCVAGGANGPTFNNGKTDTYYFQNKCYGSSCQNF